MSLSAEITGTKANVDGTVTLYLSPWKEDTPGQPLLIVQNPPKDIMTFMKAVIGLQIWGGQGQVMVGETVWATRLGSTTIRLIDKETK